MKKYLFLIATLITIGFNAAAVLLPINGVTTKFISDTLKPTIITPSGMTFAIWSVIYIGLLFISIMIAFGQYKINDKTLYYYLISCIANSLWIITWHYLFSFIPALLLITIMIFNFLTVNGLTGIYKHIYLIYASWTVIATVINTIVLFKYDFGINNIFDISDSLMAVILLTVGAIIYFLTSYKYNSLSPLLVGIWAYYGIYTFQTNEDVKSAALLYLITMSVLLIPLVYKNKKVLTSIQTF
jgi:hypothetical protein